MVLHSLIDPYKVQAELTPGIDIDAYLARLGYDGPRSPTLDTLRSLHERHPAAIAFEAIDVLLDRGIDLTPTAVDAKLITARRGGYCFEQNGLFKRALTALGFEVETFTARVLWTRPTGAPTPAFSHMVLRVTVDGQPWLADVGFGGLVLTSPLRFDTDQPQDTAHETFRLVVSGANVLLQATIDDQWQPLYRLSMEPRVQADIEQANWFTSTHPDSKFRRDLIVARATPEARYTLLNNRFGVRNPDGRLDRHVLDANEIEEALTQVFDLPVEPEWRRVIENAATVDAARN